MKVCIIGGVAGGATTATRLRRLDENIDIKIFEKGEYVSFANCGLPYYIGNTIKNESDLIVQSPQKFKEVFNILVEVSHEVLSIDRENKKLKILDIKNDKIIYEGYDILVISTGAKPILPKIENLNFNNFFTLRNIPDTKNIKEYIIKNKVKSSVIIGGGYIGIEMAENLYNLGIDVTLVEKSNSLMGVLDFEMSKIIYDYLTKKGINIVLSKEVIDIKRNKEVYEKAEAILLDDNTLINTDLVISSIGVKPDNKLAIEAKLELNEKGSIIVNEKMQTIDENIYALGDVAQIKNYITGMIDYIPLAGPANKQARVVANNICGIDSKYSGTQGSSIVKVFDMVVASTGINEKKAIENNLNYDIVYITTASHATYYPNSNPISIKVIYEKNTLKILGAQLIGKDGVDKRCDVIATAIRAGLNAYDLSDLELCYAPPFSSAKDPVNIIGNVIVNQSEGYLNSILPKELSEKIKNNLINFDEYVILDVRTKKEFDLGNIKNSINIPLNEIRENLSKIDKNKKIIVYCHSGQRSYNAYRILKNNGYDVYNLSGGYVIYKNF